MPRFITDVFWRVAFDTALFGVFDIVVHALFSTKAGKERVRSFIRNRRNPVNKIVFAALYGIFSTFGIRNTVKVLKEIETNKKPPLWLKIVMLRNKRHAKK